MSKPNGLLPSRRNSRRPREKSSHVRGLPRRDTGTHLNLCFFPSNVLKAPCLRLWTNHFSFPSSLDMNVRNTNRRIRIDGFLNCDCIQHFYDVLGRLYNALNSVADAIIFYSSYFTYLRKISSNDKEYVYEIKVLTD